MMKLILNTVMARTAASAPHIEQAVDQMDAAIERLASERDVQLFKTDYLE